MPKGLLNWIEREELKPLNEKDIQERLYGQYRKGIVRTPDTTRQNESKNEGRSEFSSSSKYEVTSGQLTNPWESLTLSIQGAAKRIPWRFAGVVLIVLIASLVVGRGTANWIEHMRETKRLREETVRAESLPVELKPNVSQKRLRSTTEGSGPLTSVEPESKVTASLFNQKQSAQVAISNEMKQRVYAIQICTYQREEDASHLVSELEALKFDAFHRKIQSTSSRPNSYFVVFLGKRDTFGAAHALLKEFKKTTLFNHFSDAFIRSL